MSGHLGGEAARKDSILAWLRQREDEMAALLSELVAIPTENPPGRNYQACAALLEKRLRNFGLDCERFGPAGLEKKSGESPACLLACYGRGKRTLYFHGHYDVVPAQSAQQFEPVRKEHFLFGRGSCDMKGGIVAMLYAILALKECGAELNGKAGLILERGDGRRGRLSMACEARAAGPQRHWDASGGTDERGGVERKPRRDFAARAGLREVRARWLAAPRRERI